MPSSSPSATGTTPASSRGNTSTSSAPSTRPTGRATSRASSRRARAATDAMDEKTTHFGYREVPEAEKSQRVGEVFRSVAPSYDLMNDLMSLGLHRLWKRFALDMSGVHEGSRVLDVASGSGDLAAAFARRVGPSGQVWMTDINADMLAVGRDKLVNRGIAAPLALCDAEKLPFRDDTFDCVSVAFR